MWPSRSHDAPTTVPVDSQLLDPHPPVCTCFWPISWNTGLPPAIRISLDTVVKGNWLKGCVRGLRSWAGWKRVGRGKAGGKGHRSGSESAPPLSLIFSLFPYLSLVLPLLIFSISLHNSPESWENTSDCSSSLSNGEAVLTHTQRGTGCSEVQVQLLTRHPGQRAPAQAQNTEQARWGRAEERQGNAHGQACLQSQSMSREDPANGGSDGDMGGISGENSSLPAAGGSGLSEVWWK